MGATTQVYINNNIAILSTFCPIKIELAKRQIEVRHLPTYKLVGKEGYAILLSAPVYTPLISHKSINIIENIVHSMERRVDVMNKSVPTLFAEYVAESKMAESEKIAIKTLCDIVNDVQRTHEDVFLLDIHKSNLMMYGRDIVFNDIFNSF